MSNIKQVHISGEMPFNTYDDHELNRFLGYLNAPSFGIRITWGKSRMTPNDHGGQTSMYQFVISGQEAVTWAWVDGLAKAIHRHGGTITNSYANDMEADGDIKKFLRRVDIF